MNSANHFNQSAGPVPVIKLFPKNMTTILHALAGIWSLLAVPVARSRFDFFNAKSADLFLPTSALL
jgi:hypothetical protein